MKKVLIKNTFWVYVFNLGVMGFGYANKLLSQLFDSTHLGSIFLTIGTLELLSLLTDWGMTSVLIFK